MRYPPEHRERTRQRILLQAGRLFRRHGYEGVGIDRIMEAAGLTRGGFYGHFPSKAKLYAEVIGGEHDFNRRLEERPGESREALASESAEIVRGYLHPDHREGVGRGCYLASCSVDVARAGRPAKAAYAAKLHELAAEFERGLVEPEPGDSRALQAIALCVGGLTLARAVDDAAFATRILAACRGLAEARLAAGPPDID